MSSSSAKPRERAANIFINYRREDTAGHAGRLFDALSKPFAGRLFMDVDTLDPGVDFVEAIEQAVGSCEALIVVIGREWLTIADKAGRPRLQDAGDFVRLEIESALARRIRVIPVLVQDAPMPRAEELPPSLARLARRNAIELSDARWSYDVERLARAIREILEEKREPGPRDQRPAEARAEPPADLRTEPRTQSATLRQVPVAPARTAAGTIGSRAWLLSLGAAMLVAAVALVSLALSGHAPWGDRGPAVAQVDPPGVAPDPGGAIGASTTPTPAATAVPAPTVAPAPNPTDAGPIPNLQVENGIVKPLHSVDGPPTDNPPRRVDVKPEGDGVPRTRVVPVATPTPAATAPHLDIDGPEVVSVAGTPAPAATPMAIPSAQPARVTILSPRNCEVVDSDLLVQGVVAGLGEQQIFLAIRQANGSIYPRGEIFPNPDGVWSIQLRSSKERTFAILVVATDDAAASRLLRDQRSRDDGLAILPPGAVVGSPIVTLKRPSKIPILHSRRGNGDC